MALNTNYFPGDSPNNILAKLLLLFGGSPTAGDGLPELLRQLLQQANGAAGGLEVPINFQDSADNADGILFTNNGVDEVLRVIGATGYVQTTSQRIHREVNNEFLALLGAIKKEKGAFCELFGSDHLKAGGAALSIHDGGIFKILSAPVDSTISISRWQVTGTTGDIEHIPVWDNAATIFTARKTDVTNTASHADSLLEDLRVGGVSMFSVDINGDAAATRNFVLGIGSASDKWVGSNDFNKYLPSNNGGSSGLMGSGNVYIQIDSNGDQADRVFAVRKDSQFAGGGTELFQISETGAATFPLGHLTVRNAIMTQSVLVYAASVAVDFDDDAQKTMALTGDITFTTSNTGTGKGVAIKIAADASVRAFTFPGTWTFVGTAAPADIAANKEAILSLTCFGAGDANVIAVYTVEP